jgi:hypothetical protein
MATSGFTPIRAPQPLGIFASDDSEPNLTIGKAMEIGQFEAGLPTKARRKLSDYPTSRQDRR